MGLVFTTSISFYIYIQLLFPSENNLNYEKHIDENIRKIISILIFFITSVLADAYFIRKTTERFYYLVRIFFIISLTILLLINIKVVYEVGLVIIALTQFMNIYFNPHSIKNE
jgi:hypothetical protein